MTAKTATLPKSGDAITWTQEHASGERIVRTGIVWDRGPALGAGHSREVWVSPDVALEADGYELILVATVPARRHHYTKAGRSFQPGETFAETHAASATGGRLAAVRAAVATIRASRGA